MNRNEFQTFKYKGKKYILRENTIEWISGFLSKAYGMYYISVNKDLPERKKQLLIHRLITGRGLWDIRRRIHD